MTDPVALLEELAKKWKALNFEICGEQGHGDESLQMCTHDLEAAIALMRAPVGDSESTAIYLRKFDVTMIGQAKHAGQDMVSVLAQLHPNDGWSVLFNVAMQQTTKEGGE